MMTDTTQAAFQPFKNFEHRGWREVAERYDAAFVGATGQSIGPMLDAVGAGPHPDKAVRLLDVACGPGYATAAAAARGGGGGSVLGVDFAAEVVALAAPDNGPGVRRARGWAGRTREGPATIPDRQG